MHLERNSARGLGMMLAMGLLLLPSVAEACSVPVFRYALERWQADPFDALVFHRGPLSAEAEAMVRELDPESGASERVANVRVQTVDLDADPARELLAAWEQLPAGTALPVVVVRYPRFFGIPLIVWSGPLNASTVGQVLESPVRREVARRLLEGDSAVWVLLEGGDAGRTAAAAAVLEKRLERLEKELEIQALDPADVASGLVSVPEDALKVAFSLVRLSRKDPAEQAFVQMLLGIEEDLHTFDEPMAFPIFGRGRALFALVGKGIVDENIDEACAFLTGPCSCQVKELNPGVDLLMAVDWDEEVYAMATASRELPELSGVAGFATNGAAGAVAEEIAPTPPAKETVGGTNGAGAIRERSRGASGGRPLVFGLATAGAAGLLVVLGGTFWLLRRR